MGRMAMCISRRTINLNFSTISSDHHRHSSLQYSYHLRNSISTTMQGLLGFALLGSFVSYLQGAAASPATAGGTEKRNPLGLSLPPLIPSIPGVTEPLASNAPPLPILQVPTPPLASPPFTASNIKPKKIGYFWTGAGDNLHKDFLATVSLDDVCSPLLVVKSGC